jgi:hypothetical protein
MSIPLLAPELVVLVPLAPVPPAPEVAPVPPAPEVAPVPLVDPELGFEPVVAVDPELGGGFPGLLLAHAAKRPSRTVETGLAIRETKRVMMTSVQGWMWREPIGGLRRRRPQKLARLP